MSLTVVVPVSPIPSHPDTAILAQTVESIRYHWPTAEIMLTFDGVRPEQESRRKAYEEHIRRALELADWKWGNVCPFIFDQHMHQVGMLRAVIDEIRTPLLMYVEQDTPLVTDEPIDWERSITLIESGKGNLVRFHHEAKIPKEHLHMMHGRLIAGDSHISFEATSQWSQRPHLTSVAYYRRILDAHFSPDAKCFIEDKMHGVVDEAYRRDGMLGWNQHRLFIYHPEGNIKRSYHLDGRAGEPKLDGTQVF